MKKVLYITYDGLLDPLGYSQIQPYLRALAGKGASLRVLSFEKAERLRGSEASLVKSRLVSCGIAWHYLRYHKRPAVAATAWDIAVGFLTGLVLVLHHRIGIIHARSYIAAAIALGLCRLTGTRFLFDMRGFWPDERVEGGTWPAGGLLYRIFKRLERIFLGRADSIVVLSHRGAELLPRMIPPRRTAPEITVIPTCADLELFQPWPGKKREAGGLKLVYIGSLGTWYLAREMTEFFGELYRRLPESTFTVITPSSPAVFYSSLEGLSLPEGAAGRIRISALPYQQVPEVLGEADCSIFFIRPVPSKQASCATKFGESLACGVPVVINSGIGDHDRQVESRNVGVVVGRMDGTGYGVALDRLLALLEDPQLARRCRKAAEEEFALDSAADSYLELYRRMSADRV